MIIAPIGTSGNSSWSPNGQATSRVGINMLKKVKNYKIHISIGKLIHPKLLREF